MPALFFGHGNPMNAIGENAWTRSWAAIGAALPRPKAVLCVSAHWYLPGTAVGAMPQPNEAVSFLVEGFDGGSISMLAVQLG
jgi:4,5-DOPA dioxygenase extradiol